MEDRTISITYKNNYQSVYDAALSYSQIKGKLSKKRLLKSLVPAVISSVLLSLIIFVLENFSFRTDYYILIVFFIIMALTTGLFMLISRTAAKSEVKRIAAMNLYDSFEAQSPHRADFSENTVTVTSGYSRVCAPYEEMDYVISDRMNFIFGFGGDMKIRSIPKNNQNPDELFALDNLLREKLGDKFIYLM